MINGVCSETLSIPGGGGTAPTADCCDMYESAIYTCNNHGGISQYQSCYSPGCNCHSYPCGQTTEPQMEGPWGSMPGFSVIPLWCCSCTPSSQMMQGWAHCCGGSGQAGGGRWGAGQRGWGGRRRGGKIKRSRRR